MVKLFTSRLTYDGKDKINATVKSGSGLGDCLAPTWALVAGHKLHEALQKQNQPEIDRWSRDKFSGQPTTPLTDAQYTDRYLALLRGRYAEDKQPFLSILNQDLATLTCYCAPGQFCHRHLAVDVLKKIAEKQAIPFERGGEIDPRTGKLWLAPDDPNRRDLQFGVVPITTPDGETSLGYAAVGIITNPKQLNIAIELGHFRRSASAESYLDSLGDSLQQKQLPLHGTRADLRLTERYLTERAQDNRLDGAAHFLTSEQNRQWTDGRFTIHHTPNELRFEPDVQEIRFGVLPIVAPDGNAKLGLTATALVEQNDKRAILELAHFTNGADQRANSYLDDIETTLIKTGYRLDGNTADIQKTVAWLTDQAHENHLPGEWQPLTDEQSQQLDSRQLTLTHSFNQVHTLSGGNYDFDRG